MLQRIYQVSCIQKTNYGKKDIILGYYTSEEKAELAINFKKNDPKFQDTEFSLLQKDFIDMPKDIPITV